MIFDHISQDRDGAGLLVATLLSLYPILTKLYADRGYQGPRFKNAVAQAMTQLEVTMSSDPTLAGLSCCPNVRLSSAP